MSKGPSSTSTPRFPSQRPSIGRRAVDKNISDIPGITNDMLETERRTPARSESPFDPSDSEADNEPSGEVNSGDEIDPSEEEIADTNSSHSHSGYREVHYRPGQKPEVTTKDKLHDNKEDEHVINEEQDKDSWYHSFLKWAVLSLILYVLINSILLKNANANNKDENKDSIQYLKETFPSQNETIWWAIESGVNDVIALKRPSSFILLYKEDAEKTLKNLVIKISEFASCKFGQCSDAPVNLTSTVLNSDEVLQDYGLIIERYQDDLKEKGVMVVENIENVAGTSACVFHAFCDQYTPLVKKSLFIFTMKVQDFHKNNVRHIEEQLRKRWIEVKTDTFAALFTRISNMVLEIYP